MSIRSDVAYIGRFVRRKLGLGSYLPEAVTAASNPTTLRVFNPELFDSVGGTLFYVDGSTDRFFTYSGINGDLLTGIPTSGSGEIAADMNAFNHATLPTLVYRGDVDDEELEGVIDAHRNFVVEELFDDASGEGKRWKTLLGWYDAAVQIRTDLDDTYSVITLAGGDTISYERGEVIFSTARTESQLWFAGFGYNPFVAIAEIIGSHQNDSRFVSYLQVGQTAQSKLTAVRLAEYWRARGVALSYCR